MLALKDSNQLKQVYKFDILNVYYKVWKHP